MTAKKRECIQEDTCPHWDTCPVKHDMNACRMLLSIETDECDIEEID